MRSMVEGARAVEKILKRQEKRRGKRPSHRARARSPLPAIAGRDKSLAGGHGLIVGAGNGR
jgi:hypothetical protein